MLAEMIITITITTCILIAIGILVIAWSVKSKSYKPFMVCTLLCVISYLIVGFVHVVEADRTQTRIEEQKKLTQLFPQPWLWAYKECPKIGNYTVRPMWFTAWTSQDEELPKLSAEAIQKFAEMMAQSYRDKDFQKATIMLAPFLKINATPEIHKPKGGN